MITFLTSETHLVSHIVFTAEGMNLRKILIVVPSNQKQIESRVCEKTFSLKCKTLLKSEPE